MIEAPDNIKFYMFFPAGHTTVTQAINIRHSSYYIASLGFRA
jgi:hypothetical protein